MTILQLHSALTDKKNFVTNFPFLTNSLTSLPLNNVPLAVGRWEATCITFARLAIQLSPQKENIKNFNIAESERSNLKLAGFSPAAINLDLI